MDMSTAMSSLICEAGHCTFTRVNTDAYAIDRSPPRPGEFPPCEICGCSWCEEGLYPLGNPQGIVDISELEFLTEDADLPPGFTEVPCALLEFAGLDGTFPEADCNDEFRTNLSFREACGCPPLPDRPEPMNATVAPTSSSPTVPTASPTFVDPSSHPWTDPINQDQLSDSVALTRDFRGPIFNAITRASGSFTEGTEWALLPEGSTFEDIRCGIEPFCDWSSCFARRSPPSMVGKPGVVHVLEEDLYYNIMFTQWTVGREDDDMGGGFQYVRDEVPIDGSTLAACPRCNQATASMSVLRGPIDHAYVNVTIEGVTPDDVTIEILSVAQKHSQECNYLSAPNATDRVRPNARIMGDMVQLRRTRILGSLSPVIYTVYFSATTDSSSTCYGNVQVCVPAPGTNSCDEGPPQFDATSSRFCTASSVNLAFPF